MLSTLQDLDTRSAQSILADLVRTLLPSPVELEGEVSTIGGVHEQVLDEIRRRLRLDPTDLSPEAHARLLEFLTKEMSEYVLGNTPIGEVKARVGQEGLLHPNQYTISFGPRYENKKVGKGIGPKDIEAAVKKPDSYQHLLTESPIGEEGQSLFVKVSRKHTGKNAFSLLIQAARKGSRLTIGRAFRVYHDDVEIAQARTPLEVLLAFLEVYGIPISVAGTHPELFTLSRTFPAPRDFYKPDGTIGALRPDQFLWLARPVMRKRCELMLRFRFNRDRTIEIEMAYAVDTVKYEESLRGHGVEW